MLGRINFLKQNYANMTKALDATVHEVTLNKMVALKEGNGTIVPKAMSLIVNI